MKELKIGVVGFSNRGELSWQVNNMNAKLVAGVEPYEELRKKTARKFQEKYHDTPRLYADYREMLEKEELDGVFITSPDFCHEEQACAFLKKHVPVYLEKPIAITIDGADHILRTACENRTKLMLGHNMRYMKFVLKMRELVRSGVIGEVKAVWCRHFVSYGGDAYFRDWHADRTKSTSLLLQKAAHDIDVIHFIAGGFSEVVQGIGGLTLYDKLPRRSGPRAMEKGDVSFNSVHWPPEKMTDFNPVINVEDINMIQMRLDNGVFASYQQCHFTPDACRNYTVIGTRGRIENYGDCGKGATVQLWTRRTDDFHLEGDEHFDVAGAQVAHGGADELIVADFLEMLRSGKAPNSTPQAARYSVAAGCLGAESIRSNGRRMAIPKLPKELEEYCFNA